MQVGLSGFLWQVGLFIILVKLQFLQNIFIDESSIPALKSPKESKHSLLVLNKSKLLLNVAMWFFLIIFFKVFFNYKQKLSANFFYFVSLSPQKTLL